MACSAGVPCWMSVLMAASTQLTHADSMMLRSLGTYLFGMNVSFLNGLGEGAARRALCWVMELRIVACLPGKARTTRLNTPWWHAQDLHLESDCLHALVFYVPCGSLPLTVGFLPVGAGL